MKASEFRTGNFHQYETATGIEIQQIEGHDICELEADPQDDFYMPIQLTEEWHNKFGVSINGFHNFEYIIEPRKKIVFSGDYIYLRDISRMDGKESMEDSLCTLWSNDKRGRGIYVHEFQNLYFCLTGKELEIVK